MWFILDKGYQTVGILGNDAPQGCPIVSDTHHGQLENGYSTLQFTVPSNHPTSSLLETEGFVVYTNGKDGYELFRIKELEESHGDDMTKVVYCETSATSDLTGQIIRPITFTSKSLTDVISTLLSNTGWELGESYYDALMTIEFTDYPTVLEAIRTAISSFGAEIEFKVEMSGLRIVRRVVNLYEKRGQVTDAIFEYGYNLQGVKRKEDSNKVYTAMIGVGKEDANGKQISIIDAQVVPPSPFEKVDDYVGDTDALEKWGNNGQHVFGVFNDQNATNAVELYNNTLAELKKYNKPQLSYEVEVAMLEQITGYDHTKVSIGDTILVKDTTFNPPLYLEARVLEKELSTVEPDKGKITLGEYVLIKVQPILAIQKLQKTIQLKQDEWNKAYEKAQEAQDAVSQIKDQIKVKVQGVQTFKNGQGEITYVASLFQNGTEIDLDGTEYIYCWSMYDITNTKIPGFARTGKSLTLKATDFDTRVDLDCKVYQ
ncbi:phage tail spike protein [Priestia aryabhattai]|uniref:phage tail spike protein n=1 Tax=Priestia aryabhattai TaxID=412384 RepID=UPI002E1B074A|nr:phage tail spike protein [Priestia aryabhattai]MED4261962.1 phage tail spike protein [Priestia aryabhattai]